ncbi:hypothetical protein [Methylobacterium frigidaeris]|uniref:Uncharacterized protein n=1 Tax=Methylobacterium frigidaeris TaxID=2038277 RepID=A0AA37HFR5_9HYPH|nr:hypothetical protein [Methylobacterium frigidaeris]PIK73868.1 hypothetical protein CS379_05860 [Methylobacterium frigidaeris]GJD65206.1 hypothetical protein MPEAHAMD_5393 [Methylobacterium frigidaeris]
MGPELILLALAEIGAGNATGTRVTPRQFVDNPKAYVEKTVVIPGIACVNPPKGDFLCMMKVGGQVLRIQASGLGPKTNLTIAERLTGDCKGTANLENPACKVDAEFTPRTVVKDAVDTPWGSLPVVEVYAPQVEMYRPKR